MHKGSFSWYSATGLSTRISDSEYLDLFRSSGENRFNRTEISQQTKQNLCFIPYSGPELLCDSKLYFFFLCWGFPLCQDWFHPTLGVTLLVKGKEISIFREWLMWPILDVTFSLRRITPLIKTCFTLSYITATIGHTDHLNLEEKSLTGELGASLSLFAHKHFNYTTERVAKATGAFICFLWSHTEQHYLILRAQFCFIYESSYFQEEKKIRASEEILQLFILE